MARECGPGGDRAAVQRGLGGENGILAAFGDSPFDLELLATARLAVAVAPRAELGTIVERTSQKDEIEVAPVLTREEILARYMLRSGRDVSAIRFYEVFARFKIAVVIQQIYFRFVNGQTSDPRFANFVERVAHLARRAAEIAGD